MNTWPVLLQILAILLLILKNVQCAKILGFFFCPSISHQFVFRPIMKELALMGHDVTFATPDPINDPSLTNLKEIDMSSAYKYLEDKDASIFNRDSNSMIWIELAAQKAFSEIVEIEMGLENVQKIMNQSENSYDLVIIEGLIPFHFGFQHKFKAPMIALSSLPLNTFVYTSLGVSIHPVVYTSTYMVPYLNPVKSIWGKLDSLYVYLVTIFLNRFVNMPAYDRLGRKYFGDDMPYIEDLVKDTSVFFSYENPILSRRRHLPGNVMILDNVHLDRDEELPWDLQDILDGAEEGVVYFSLGTNVRFHHLNEDVKGSILEALGELPYTVLLKWSGEEDPAKPDNVILRKWFPQQSVLAHPNVKVFVTQGGLQSSEEAISNGVPMVAIPFLGDQPMNAKILTGKGMAETILPKEFTKELLKEKILKVARNDSYRKKAEELRSIFLDQPQSGLDKVVWWCEYVIRHKGAKHLKSPAADIPLYEYLMLDVLAFVLISLYVFYKLILFQLRWFFRLMTRSKTIESKKKN